MNEAVRQAVLVTGASSGIGKATALRLAAQGRAIGLVGLHRSELEAVAEEVSALGGDGLCLPADVSIAAEVEDAVAQTIARFGDLSGVVCAAGIALKGAVTTIGEEAWHKTLAVNLTGTYLTARFSMPSLIRHGRSSFVAISSDAGIRGSAGYAAYCASKHGVVGLIRCMALDHGPAGVRSNVVCPTFVDTPMAEELLRDSYPYDRAFYERRVPLGRFARPEEIAATVDHLLSEQASYSNGMVYVIDGGTTAGTFG